MKFTAASAALLVGLASAAPADKPAQYANYGSYPAAPKGYGKYGSYGDYKNVDYGKYGSYGTHKDGVKPPQAPPAHPAPQPTPSKPAQPPATTPTGAPKAVYGIKSFTERRLNGVQQPPTSVSFNITGNNVNVACSPYNPATDSITNNFTIGTTYFCGQNSEFSFSYTDGTNGQNNTLFLFQGTRPENTISGSVSFADPICRAGGSGANDFICTYPDGLVPDLTISLRTV